MDADRHNVGKVLAIGSRHVDKALADAQVGEVASDADGARRRIEAETSVLVAGNNPVDDRVSLIEIHGRQGQQFRADGRCPRDASDAADALELWPVVVDVSDNDRHQQLRLPSVGCSPIGCPDFQQVPKDAIRYGTLNFVTCVWNQRL